MIKHTVITKPKGFTLVELLIVVIILAILAAIVVPQFATSTEDAKLSAMDSTLANVRSIIDIYYQQHGHYPSAVTAAGATCAVGTAGAGAVNTPEAFMSQLTLYSNAAGQTCTGKSGNFIYGPYIKKDTLPNNPMTDNNSLVISIAGVLGMTGNATAAGWKFDNLTGQFITDDAAYDDR